MEIKNQKKFIADLQTLIKYGKRGKSGTLVKTLMFKVRWSKGLQQRRIYWASKRLFKLTQMENYLKTLNKNEKISKKPNDKENKIRI